MFRPREDADKSSEDQLKTPLCFRGRKLRNGWLFANDVLQLGDEIDHQQAVRLQRLLKCVTPLAHLIFALTEEWPDKTLKRLRQRRIRDVTLILVELARGEQSAWRDQRLVK